MKKSSETGTVQRKIISDRLQLYDYRRPSLNNQKVNHPCWDKISHFVNCFNCFLFVAGYFRWSCLPYCIIYEIDNCAGIKWKLSLSISTVRNFSFLHCFITDSSNGYLFDVNAFRVNHLVKMTFLLSKVALWWLKMKCCFLVPSWKWQRATEIETWMHSEKKLMIYVVILIFIFGMVVQHLYLITKRGDQKPQIFIYICKNTKLSKIFGWKFTIVLTKSFDVVFVLKYSQPNTKKKFSFAKQFSHLKNKRKQINIDGDFMQLKRTRLSVALYIMKRPLELLHLNWQYFTIFILLLTIFITLSLNCILHLDIVICNERSFLRITVWCRD